MKILRNIPLIAVLSLFIAGCDWKNGETALDSLSDTLKIKQVSTTYTITGIGLRGSNKVAIINDAVITPGTELAPGVVLKDVQLTYAVILHEGTEHLLRPESIQNELDQKKKH